MKKTVSKGISHGRIAENRRAKFDYSIVDTIEAGIVLLGSEVKSLRLGRASIAESYATEEYGHVVLINSNIPEYSSAASGQNHEPKRVRRLLIHKKEKNKILVSNGKSLVIKTQTSFYRYPLNKTPLNLILDKNFLIKKIVNLKENILNKSYINFEIIENDSEINIFFDNKTFNLVGWQTKDIYQNINVTYLSSIKINQQVDKNLFKLPTQN